MKNDAIREVLVDIGKRLDRLEKKTERYCSFCHKSELVVEVLIISESKGVCNECLDLCNKIIEERKAGK